MKLRCKHLASNLFLTLSLGGCSLFPGVPAWVPEKLPLSSGEDCERQAVNVAQFSVRMEQLRAQLDAAQAQDRAVLASGQLLYWPALFPVGGDKQVQAEYGQLQAEQNTLKQRMVASRCVLRP